MLAAQRGGWYLVSAVSHLNNEVQRLVLNINALKRCQESIDDWSNNTCIKGKTDH